MAIVQLTSWLRVLGPASAPASTRTLVCFPPGGGSAAAYRDWPAELAGADVTVLGVQYPGRRDRFLDEPLSDLMAMADAIAADLRQAALGRVSLFGHSMGATVAFEVARRLGDDVAILFVSGRPDPSFEERGALHRESNEALIDSLAALANDPDSVRALRENPDVADLVLPALRSDYQAVETYRMRDGVALTCDIVALVSDDDPTTSVAQAQGWQRHTTGGFELAQFSGGHFYLDEPAQRAEVCATVRRRL